jgi:prepilin-type N-terminal cleavage/methylation domain-containing protein
MKRLSLALGWSAPAPRLEPGRSVRRGNTLIEIMVALTIITTALLGFGAFIGRFMHATSQAEVSSIAMDLAVSRVELIKAWPTYATLEATFNGTNASLPNCTGCVMTTLITKDSTAIVDYKTVTVKITVPALNSAYTETPVLVPFEKTTVISIF